MTDNQYAGLVLYILFLFAFGMWYVIDVAVKLETLQRRLDDIYARVVEVENKVDKNKPPAGFYSGL